MSRRFKSLLNDVVHGDCIEVMSAMPWASVDFILTDPLGSARFAHAYAIMGGAVVNGIKLNPDATAIQLPRGRKR